MDRPEDIDVNPVNGRVYVVLTNNTNRGVGANAGHATQGTNAANPRANNTFGHVIELTEDGGDHGATRFRWGVFMLCGPQADPSRMFSTYGDVANVVDIACPDNLAFDRQGNLWIATDGQPGTIRKNDGFYAVVTEDAHPERGRPRLFSTMPAGAECTGPTFTPGDQTLFLSVQHPGESGTAAAPQSHWPDYDSGYQPRPAVVWVGRSGRERRIGA
jgi:secreted PhoX family phosphatase